MRRTPGPPVELMPGLGGQLGENEIRAGCQLVAFTGSHLMFEISRRMRDAGVWFGRMPVCRSFTRVSRQARMSYDAR